MAATGRVGVPRDPSHLREMNKLLVRNVFRRDGPLTRVDAARISGLTKPTISAIVRELVDEDVLVELDEKVAVSSGISPRMYRYNNLAKLFAGVHIGVTTTDAMITDALGEQLGALSQPTPVRDAHGALDRAADLLRRCLNEHRLPHDRIAGVGVCLSGLVDTDAGRCLLAPNLGWKDVDVARYFETGAPVVVHNVIHAALEAEHREGAAVGVADTALLLEDNGVGMALMTRGQVYTGADGFAGELGHCKVPGAVEPCGCGGVGCLETRVSAQAVLRRAAGLLSPDLPPAQVFATLASSDDPAAAGLLRRVGEEVGSAAAWVVNLFNPRVLLLGGTFGSAGPVFEQAVASTISGHSLFDLARSVQVRSSRFPLTGAARGALLLARRRVDEMDEQR